MIRALLNNHERPEQQPVSVCFPIVNHDEVYEMLGKIDVGSATGRDCGVEEIAGDYPALARLEDTVVNLDELDYLAKRLESFDKTEIAKFQSCAEAFDYKGLPDLINLTFCCQEITVIQDFTDINAIGLLHHLDVNGAVAVDELKYLDGSKIARNLFQHEKGLVTPYGVLYDNSMEMEQVYKGREFPRYWYDDRVMELAVTKLSEREDTPYITWLYLPMTDKQIDRSLERGGFESWGDMRLELYDYMMPPNAAKIVKGSGECLENLNALAKTLSGMSEGALKKLDAVIEYAEPDSAEQVTRLGENLEYFKFFEGALTPEDYGRRAVELAGNTPFADGLDEFIDFQKYGERLISNLNGKFVSGGHVSYNGLKPIEELMRDAPAEHMDMGMEMY